VFLECPIPLPPTGSPAGCGDTSRPEIVAVSEPPLEILLIGPVAETSRRWLSGTPGVALAGADKELPDRIWRSPRTG